MVLNLGFVVETRSKFVCPKGKQTRYGRAFGALGSMHSKHPNVALYLLKCFPGDNKYTTMARKEQAKKRAGRNASRTSGASFTENLFIFDFISTSFFVNLN